MLIYKGDTIKNFGEYLPSPFTLLFMMLTMRRAPQQPQPKKILQMLLI